MPALASFGSSEGRLNSIYDLPNFVKDKSCEITCKAFTVRVRWYISVAFDHPMMDIFHELSRSNGHNSGSRSIQLTKS
jgi:hypothetical protein